MPAHRDLLWAGWSEDDAMELAHAHARKYGALIPNHLEHQLLSASILYSYLKNL